MAPTAETDPAGFHMPATTTAAWKTGRKGGDELSCKTRLCTCIHPPKAEHGAGSMGAARTRAGMIGAVAVLEEAITGAIRVAGALCTRWRRRTFIFSHRA